jgi:hypothetical protein
MITRCKQQMRFYFIKYKYGDLYVSRDEFCDYNAHQYVNT